MADPPGDAAQDFRRRSAPKRPREAAAEDYITEDHYKPFIKPGYKRTFPENGGEQIFTVFVEYDQTDRKLGNYNPLMLASLFKNEIKGVINLRRINATKVGVVFNQAIFANNFLKNEEFLTRNKLRAFIPARAVEVTGVLRYVPVSISNEELLRSYHPNTKLFLSDVSLKEKMVG